MSRGIRAPGRDKLFHPQEGGDKTVTKATKSELAGHEFRPHSVASDQAKAIGLIRYAFRNFDRQWIIPDNRLINRPNPNLWNAWSNKLIYAMAPEDQPLRPPGPAITFSSLAPDLHHFNGRGGQVYPFWSDAPATQSNVRASVPQSLAEACGSPVSPEDIFAYIAAVIAHPAFTGRLKADLIRPGLRVPLTADKALFDEAVALGCEVV